MILRFLPSPLLLALVLLSCGEGDTHHGPWTTTSDEALGRFEEGHEAWTKEYFPDAIRHFQAALALDPDFAAARHFLAASFPSSHPERRRHLDHLMGSDLSTLSDTERFLVRFDLARTGLINDTPRQLLDDFLEENPEDPFGLTALCDISWEEQDWDTAEPCYRRLEERFPNRVMAHDRLGLIAMARGQFNDAEFHFLTYRYLAPDHTLPWQRLGELYTVLGRYKKADRALAEALAIKSDFCEAHRVRVKSRAAAGKLDEARQHLQAMETLPACGHYAASGFYCSMEGWLDYLEGDAEGAWNHLGGACLEQRNGFDMAAHRVALVTGRDAEAASIEAALHDYFELLSIADLPVYTAFYAAVAGHMEGLRHLAEGDAEEAAESFQHVDERLGYWGGDRAGFKLLNRRLWIRALEIQGDMQGARKVRKQIKAINPRFLKDFPMPEFPYGILAEAADP